MTLINCFFPILPQDKIESLNCKIPLSLNFIVYIIIYHHFQKVETQIQITMLFDQNSKEKPNDYVLYQIQGTIN